MWKLDRQAIHSLSLLGRDNLCSRYSGGGYTDTRVIEGYNVQKEQHDGFVSFRIWSPRDECLSIVFEDGSKVAALMWLKYDPKCQSDGKMEKGTGTKNMLEFALRKAKEYGYTHIELTDTSKIDCNGTKIDLAPMYFLQHGVTWYERWFGFHPREEYTQEYELMKQTRLKVLDIKMLKQQPCDYFTRQKVKSLLREIQGDRDILNLTSWVKEL